MKKNIKTFEEFGFFDRIKDKLKPYEEFNVGDYVKLEFIPEYATNDGELKSIKLGADPVDLFAEILAIKGSGKEVEFKTVDYTFWSNKYLIIKKLTNKEIEKYKAAKNI